MPRLTLTSLAASAALTAMATASAEPVPRAPDRPQRMPDREWSIAFETQKRELAAAPADVCFVGDSLTEFWASAGSGIWQLEFHRYRAVNFGMAGDRTENILYRLQHAGLAEHPPRVFVVLAGTNNLAAESPDTPEATADAVGAIIGLLLKTCRESRVLLLALPPNGHEPESALRERVLATNVLLEQMARDLPDRVTFLDVYPTFADGSHRWKPGLTTDGTHLSLQGYDHLARALAPAIQAALGSDRP